MSTENKIFTDSVRPEDSVSLSDLKNDGNGVHYAQMKCSGYTDDECKTWLIKIAILSDFMDVFGKILVD